MDQEAYRRQRWGQRQSMPKCKVCGKPLKGLDGHGACLKAIRDGKTSQKGGR